MSDSPTPSVGDALRNALSQPPKRTILRILVENAGTTLNPSRICDRANIDLETFYDHIGGLEASRLVTYSYVVGNGPRYEVDRDALASAFQPTER